MRFIEDNIDKEKLLSFYRSGEVTDVAEEDKSLFNFWRKIKKMSDEEKQANVQETEVDDADIEMEETDENESTDVSPIQTVDAE